MNKLWLKGLPIILTAATLIGGFSACGPSKKVAENSVTVEVQPKLTNYEELYTKSFVYENFTGKARMRYEGNGQKQSFTATIKMKKGEKVWASIVALGIQEVARALITPEKLQAVERLSRSAYDMSFEEGVRKLNAPISFDMLENLLIGNPVVTGAQVSSVKLVEENVEITVKKDEYVQLLTYNIDTRQLLTQTISSENKNFQCTIQYSNYTILGGQNFALKRSISIEDKAKGQSTLLEMEFINEDLNGGIDFNFSIPSNYKLKEL